MTASNFFASAAALGTSVLVGTVVQLQRTIDKPCRCGETSIIIGQPVGPHVAALFCTNCRKHRGWLPKQVASFLSETTSIFGASSLPIIIRDSSNSGS